MLNGKMTVLKPLEWEDLPILHRWHLDPEVAYWGSGSHPDTYYSIYDLEERYEREARNESVKRFMIYTLDDESIGSVSIRFRDKQAGNGILAIFIGEQNYWGRGYGTDALRVFLEYLFDQWNFHRIELETWAGNERAIRTYEKCGFVIEGRLREGFYVRGQYYDRVQMGILRSDYDALKDSWR